MQHVLTTLYDRIESDIGAIRDTVPVAVHARGTRMSTVTTGKGRGQKT